jgi:hypothetical protein
METRKARTALASAALAVALMAAAGAARAAPIPSYPVESCYDAYVDCGTPEYETGTFTESWDAYSFARGNCRTRYVRATRRNLARFVVFRYNEQVKWCWSAGLLTYFWRDRWPSDTSFGWTFDGHIGSNCALEHCNGRGVGTSQTDAYTQGAFHACITWFCPHKYPIVSMWVRGDGTSGASWSGA